MGNQGHSGNGTRMICEWLWDGGLMPPRPEDLEEGRKMGDSDGG